MKTTALRIYGKMDLRLETFELPPLREDEILAEIVSDSICMSSYKAAKQGPDHKRVPNDIAEHPTILGHEFAGRIVEVGKKWQDRFQPGQKFSIQPALNYKGSLDAPGYSYRYIGGDATYVIIPPEVMEMDCLLPYHGEAFFMASLSEPMSCIIGTVHAMYHIAPGDFVHEMGPKPNGASAILAGAGPMGMGAIDYLIHGPYKPRLLVVTDIDQARLDRAASILSPEDAKANGVDLRYLNTRVDNPVELLLQQTEGNGFDDVYVFAPVAPVVEQADAILGRDGCLNFFAGPTDPNFSAKLNFYNVHYQGTHVVGTSGGRTADMREALQLMGEGKINPAMMITHIGGLTAARETTLHLPEIPGGKKLIYTHLDLPLTAIEDFAEKGKENPLFRELAAICERNNGLWSLEAEQYLLANAPRVNGE
ncbi:MAG: L-sorbose 1-phosphate reductase [Lentisphaerae bacterium]|nr:MAG: L-sorbose 1-phosphate reductase [Lentisphaerota bacterium]